MVEREPHFSSTRDCGIGSIECMEDVIVVWRQESPEQARAVDEELGRIADRLRELGATRVVLLGSRALGTSHRYSDVDLIAGMPSPPPGTFPQRLKAVYEAVAPHVDADILVYTPSEVQRLTASGGMLAQALATGIDLLGETQDDHGI